MPIKACFAFIFLLAADVIALLLPIYTVNDLQLSSRLLATLVLGFAFGHSSRDDKRLEGMLPPFFR
jgi:hypothetical protein